MFKEPINAFFSLRGHAVDALLAGAEVQGIVEAGHDAATLEGFGLGAGSTPTFLMASNHVPEACEGSLLIIGGGPATGRYRVGNVKHDGTGLCTLELLNY